jgi:hypothetical protein
MSTQTPARRVVRETNGRRTFTDEQAQDIILSYLRGQHSTAWLAREHGVNQAAMYKMCTGATYRDQYRKALARHNGTSAFLGWSEPPATNMGRPTSSAMSELMMLLRAHPGRWAQVRQNAPGQNKNPGVQYLKTMGLDAEARREADGSWSVWARYPVTFAVAAGINPAAAA